MYGAPSQCIRAVYVLPAAEAVQRVVVISASDDVTAYSNVGQTTYIDVYIVFQVGDLYRWGDLSPMVQLMESRAQNYMFADSQNLHQSLVTACRVVF